MNTHVLLIVGNTGNVFASETGIPNMPLISDVDLPALYSGATACINPSFYEGFGLTILEAMACGAPVLASDIPVFREVYEDAVLYFDPHNPANMAKVIRNFVGEKSLSENLRERGLQLSKKYTWETSAQETEKIIHYAGEAS